LTLPAGATIKFARSSNLELASDLTTNLEVTAVVTTAGSNSITVVGDVAVTEAEKVVSSPRGEYKITAKTVTLDEFEYTPSNVLLPYMPHGRVKESLVIGLTAAAKAEMKPMVIFDARTTA